MNPYLYANGNPAAFIDKEGLAYIGIGAPGGPIYTPRTFENNPYMIPTDPNGNPIFNPLMSTAYNPFASFPDPQTVAQQLQNASTATLGAALASLVSPVTAPASPYLATASFCFASAGIFSIPTR
jgi:hypothetical protein